MATPELPTMDDLIPEGVEPPKPIEPVAGAQVSQDLIPAEDRRVDMPNVATTAATAQPGDTVASEGRPVTAEETTRGQIEDLLSGPSRYLQTARERGKRAAAERGNVNTSLAGQAGEAAAIEAALPIAQSDAQAYERRALSQQEHLQSLTETSHQGRVNAALQFQQHMESMDQLARSGDIDAQLLLQRAGYDSQLSAQENYQRMKEQAQQGNINARLALQNFNHNTILEDQAQGHRLELEDVRLQNEFEIMAQQLDDAKVLRGIDQTNWIEQQNMIHRDNLAEIGAQSDNRIRELEAAGDIDAANDIRRAGQNLQDRYLTSVSNIYTNGGAEIAAVMQTEGLTPAQQQNAIYQIRKRMDADIKMLGDQYANSPLWDSDWANPGHSGPLPGTTSGTTAPTGPASPPTTNGGDLIPREPSNYPIRPQEQYLLDQMSRY